MLTRQWHLGHLLLAALMLATLALGWRAFQVAREPLPVPPPFTAPPMADRALLARLDPFFPARTDSAGALPVTALPLSLHGVRADSATGRGSAIIASGDGTQKVFAVGEAVTDGVTLAAIAADHVVIDRAGVREALWLDSGSGETVQRFDPAVALAPPPPTPPSVSPDGSDAPMQGPPANDAAEMPAVPAQGPNGSDG